MSDFELWSIVFILVKLQQYKLGYDFINLYILILIFNTNNHKFNSNRFQPKYKSKPHFLPLKWSLMDIYNKKGQ